MARRFVAALAALLLCLPSHAADLIGRATVIDGDTISIHGETIRLDGVDAPESWQSCEDETGAPYPCGRVSAKALDRFLSASRPTACNRVGQDRYGRIVAICFRADGREVNRWMVRWGHALDWKRYSHGRYADDEAAAKAGGRGMWRGEFVEPWTARQMRD